MLHRFLFVVCFALSHHGFIWSLMYLTGCFPPSLPVRLFFCSLTMYRACSQSDLHRISPVVYRSNVCICANKYPAYPTSTMFILVLLFVRWVFIPFVVSHQPYTYHKQICRAGRIKLTRLYHIPGTRYTRRFIMYTALRNSFQFWYI